MTREEFRELSFRNIDDVVRINNEEGCWSFNDVYRLNDDCIYDMVMNHLKKYGVIDIKWMLEDVHTNNDEAYIYIDGYGCLKDLDEERFDLLKNDLERELEEKGFFDEEEEEEDEE